MPAPTTEELPLVWGSKAARRTLAATMLAAALLCALGALEAGVGLPGGTTPAREVAA